MPEDVEALKHLSEAPKLLKDLIKGQCREPEHVMRGGEVHSADEGTGVPSQEFCPGQSGKVFQGRWRPVGPRATGPVPQQAEAPSQATRDVMHCGNERPTVPDEADAVNGVVCVEGVSPSVGQPSTDVQELVDCPAAAGSFIQPLAVGATPGLSDSPGVGQPLEPSQEPQARLPQTQDEYLMLLREFFPAHFWGRGTPP